MIDFTKNNNSIVADNKVNIGGLTYMMTDDECIQLRDIINGMISTRDNGTQQNLAPQTKSEPKQKKAVPTLKGDAVTIGDFITTYRESLAVRIGENGTFVPKPAFNGIRHALQEAGSKWDKDLQANVFTTKKDFDAFVKAQKEYEKNRK